MTGNLDQNKAASILSSQVLGRLACADNNIPYIIPVSYVYDGTYIYAQTNEGMKLDIMRKNPNVCFEVDIVNSFRNWESVIVYGKFEELKNEAADKAREILFGRVFQLMTPSTVHPHEHGTNARLDDSARVKNTMYRIKIEKITARFEKQ